MKNIKGFFQYITENMDIKSKVNAAIGELLTIGYLNPINSREIILHDTAAVEVSYFDGVLWLSSIQSYEKGAGTKAMRTLMEVATKHDIAIHLSPEPFGEKGMNKTQLKRWYNSLGFKTVWGDIMEWKPEPNSEMGKYNITDQDVSIFKELFEMEADPMFRAWVTPAHVQSLTKLYKAGAITKGILHNKVMFYVDDAIENFSLALELLDAANVENKDSFFYQRMHRCFTKYADKNNI
jgi:hypothetical protein